MAGAGTKAKYEAKQAHLSVIISMLGDRPGSWLVTYAHNEKGDTKQVEVTVSRGEWARHPETLDDFIKALAWVARNLYAEMEARNG